MPVLLDVVIDRLREVFPANRLRTLIATHLDTCTDVDDMLNILD